mmetsp:Transcript_4332/g.4484  ORF Transcript_4332/g.4484 Transcript_4332/m.4484 type:complete len:101 (-) Transcript_4332:74-376(-)
MATSAEFWASSKIIGRECSKVNKAFLVCIKDKDGNATECEEETNLANSCAAHITERMNKNTKVEFTEFQKCLNESDFRFDDCRKQEKLFLDLWKEKRTLN